jgi:hypothetical protein
MRALAFFLLARVSATASLLTNARLKTNATKIPGIMLSEKLDLVFIMLLTR